MLYGAIVGDICGQPYEGKPPVKNVELFKKGCTFTDDTVLTCAVANTLIYHDPDVNLYSKFLKEYALSNPYRWYGPSFINWAMDEDSRPYNSFGNGAIMRVSPVAWAFDDINKVLEHAERSAMPSHNHPEGVKGARAIAHSIFLARKGSDKDYILKNLEFNYGYPLLDEETIIKENDFTMTCQKSIPTVMCAINNSNSFEECIIKAISYGWDTDTNAAIAGSIAEALYGVPIELEIKARNLLTVELANVIDEFNELYY